MVSMSYRDQTGRGRPGAATEHILSRLVIEQDNPAPIKGDMAECNLKSPCVFQLDVLAGRRIFTHALPSVVLVGPNYSADAVVRLITIRDVHIRLGVGSFSS